MDADLVPTVAVGKLPGGDATDCIRTLTAEALASPDGLAQVIPPRSRVMVIADFGPAFCSGSPDNYIRVLTASVRLIRSCGARVSVGDSAAVRGFKTGWLYRQMRLHEIGRRCGFHLTNFELSRLDLRLLESRLYMIPRDVLQADVVINIAHASPSPRLGVRGALVNLAGAVPGMRHRLARLEQTSTSQAGERLADILSLITPSFNILLFNNDLGEPNALVSADSVAADAVVAACFGIAGPDLPLVRAAAGSGLGIGHVEAVKWLGDKFLTAQKRVPMKRSVWRSSVRTLNRWVHVEGTNARIDTSLCIDCGMCEVTCPANAIKANNGARKRSIDRNRCQSCFCCHEVCPSGAISYHSMRESN